MLENFLNRWLMVPYTLHVHTKRKPKKPRATVLFLHGIGNSGEAWDQVIEKLPNDIAVVSIDLLGFGKSPRPKRAKYNATTQARSVIATLLRSGFSGKLIVVGHSLGALVAIEVAKKYPLIVKSLILCSPPLYLGQENEISGRREQRLKKIYSLLQDHPEQFVKITQLGAKYKLVGKSFDLNYDNVESFMETLRSSIVNQTALRDAISVKRPMTILHGRFDSYVIKVNLQYLQQHNSMVTLRIVAAGHEIRLLYVDAVVREINKCIKTSQ